MRLTPLGKAYAALLRDIAIGSVLLVPLVLALSFHPWKP
jgi:hypothetical protein